MTFRIVETYFIHFFRAFPRSESDVGEPLPLFTSGFRGMEASDEFEPIGVPSIDRSCRKGVLGVPDIGVSTGEGTNDIEAKRVPFPEVSMAPRSP